MKSTAVRFMSLCLFLCNPLLLLADWSDTIDFESAMTNALASEDILVSTNFTEKLRTFIATSESEYNVASAKLILSISNMTQFDRTLDDRYYPEAISLSSNIVYGVGTDTNYWQGPCASLLYTTDMAMGTNSLQAYSISTNIINIVQTSGYPEPENIVSARIMKYYKADDLTMLEGLHFAAGFSAAHAQLRSEAETHMAKLPQKWRSIIIGAYP